MTHPSPPAAPLIRLDAVTKRYGPVVAILELSLAVGEGEVFALIGPSGSGKSTALRLIAGFERPDAGSVLLRGLTIAGPGSFVPPERRGVGMVFQDYALFPHLSVAHNVAFGLRRQSRDARTRRVDEVLALVGLAGLGARYPHQLSGGQQQRVALARALAPAPAVLLLDEPLSNLDADLRARTRQDLAAILRAAGSTAIFVTHDQQEAFVLADRVGVLAAGRLEQVGTPEEIYELPASRFVADFVGEADFLPAQAHGAELVTELGVVMLPRLSTTPNLDLMVRPDDVDLAPDPTSGVRIVAREYRGEEVAYTLRLASGRTLHSHLRHGNFEPGAPVRPILKLRRTVAFPSPSPATGATQAE